MSAEPEILEYAQAPASPAWKTLDPSNPPLALSVLPGQIVALIFGIAGMARNMKFARLGDVTMPDTWMQAVAKVEDLSEEGLEHLAAALDRAGRISLEDALNWIVIEDRAIRAAINAGAKKKPKAGKFSKKRATPSALPGTCSNRKRPNSMPGNTTKCWNNWAAPTEPFASAQSLSMKR